MSLPSSLIRTSRLVGWILTSTLAGFREILMLNAPYTPGGRISLYTSFRLKLKFLLSTGRSFINIYCRSRRGRWILILPRSILTRICSSTNSWSVSSKWFIFTLRAAAARSIREGAGLKSKRVRPALVRTKRFSG